MSNSSGVCWRADGESGRLTLRDASFGRLRHGANSAVLSVLMLR